MRGATKESLRSAAEVALFEVPAVRVVVVSDVGVIAAGLGRLLPRHTYAWSALVARSEEDLVAGVRRAEADVVLVDGTIDRATEFVRVLSAPPGELAVVALGVASASAALELLSAGARAYVDEEATVAELARALEAAVRGDAAPPPRLVGELLRQTLLERRWSAQGQQLTRRETEIAELLREGASNKLIAEELQIEVSTVKNHVHSILAKLGTHDRRELGGSRSQAN